MSINSLLELSVESIRKYKILIDEHKGSKEYGNDIVSCYNTLGENIEALTEEIEDVFGNDERYNNHFENDEVQDDISLWLNKAFNEYELLKEEKSCEEKVALAYEYLFEVMLFTSDDEEIKSKITLNNNDITLLKNPNPITETINEKSVVLVKVKSEGKTEEMFLEIEETIDDFLYSYLGDKENEEDLIIFPIDRVFSVK